MLLLPADHPLLHAYDCPDASKYKEQGLANFHRFIEHYYQNVPPQAIATIPVTRAA